MKRGSKVAIGAGVAVPALLVVGFFEFGGYSTYSGSVAEADVIGAWTSDCGGSLDITADKKASAVNLPDAVSDASGNFDKPFTGSGTWALWEPGSDPALGNVPELDLRFDNTAISPDFVSVHGRLGLSFDSSDGGHDGTGVCVYTRSSGS